MRKRSANDISVNIVYEDVDPTSLLVLDAAMARCGVDVATVTGNADEAQ